jgi:hypothetical protein
MQQGDIGGETVGYASHVSASRAFTGRSALLGLPGAASANAKVACSDG